LSEEKERALEEARKGCEFLLKNMQVGREGGREGGKGGAGKK